MTRVKLTFSDARVRRDEHGEGGEAAAPPGAVDQRAADERPGGVGPGVAEHGGPGEVGPQDAEGGAAAAAARPAPAPPSEQRDGAEHRRLQRPPRAQVEEVGEVGRGGDDRTADQGVERADVVAPPVGERRGGEPGARRCRRP